MTLEEFAQRQRVIQVSLLGAAQQRNACEQQYAAAIMSGDNAAADIHRQHVHVQVDCVLDLQTQLILLQREFLLNNN